VYSAPTVCPTCGQALEVRELHCSHCATTIRGRWSPSVFERLTEDQQTFLRLFVRSRGNLSEVERSLGVSYPTVRAKLEEIIDLLQDAPASRPAPSETRDEVLRLIASGQLNVDEGLERLQRIAAKGTATS
jgi:hypothetical protein